jgi:hypothetical protein
LKVILENPAYAQLRRSHGRRYAIRIGEPKAVDAEIVGRFLAIAQAPTSTAGSIADDTKLGLSTMVVPQFFCALPLPKKWVAKKMPA